MIVSLLVISGLIWFSLDSIFRTAAQKHHKVQSSLAAKRVNVVVGSSKTFVKRWRAKPIPFFAFFCTASRMHFPFWEAPKGRKKKNKHTETNSLHIHTKRDRTHTKPLKQAKQNTMKTVTACLTSNYSQSLSLLQNFFILFFNFFCPLLFHWFHYVSHFIHIYLYK